MAAATVCGEGESPAQNQQSGVPCRKNSMSLVSSRSSHVPLSAGFGQPSTLVKANMRMIHE
jgi:hypothetical protein